jgi:hypothetical protein
MRNRIERNGSRTAIAALKKQKKLNHESFYYTVSEIILSSRSKAHTGTLNLQSSLAAITQCITV